MVKYGIRMHLRKPDLKLRGKTFAILKKSFCVYIWKRGKQYLFAGYSASLFNRLYLHNIIDRSEPFQSNDSLDIFVCRDEPMAKRMLERILRKDKPIYSPSEMPRDLAPRPCMMCHQEFPPKRRWQKYCEKCSR